MKMMFPCYNIAYPYPSSTSSTRRLITSRCKLSRKFPRWQILLQEYVIRNVSYSREGSRFQRYTDPARGCETLSEYVVYGRQTRDESLLEEGNKMGNGDRKRRQTTVSREIGGRVYFRDEHQQRNLLRTFSVPFFVPSSLEHLHRKV